ncbi:dihydroorotase [Legionella erythra]|uniref:Dihydroorotase n=1 Tax=Legionella erythra TaxID=448 RepID=A0A0W0TG56_LEGER|nr:dihydroorotase [Legionella erythra]KTC94554.1 dihydroorotase, homodimeric type [Legionella erythra]
MQTLVITRPDDWHVHFRDGDALQNTVPATGRHFGRALAMPNLKPALTSVKAVLAYRERLLKALPSSYDFVPYMTLYINEQVKPEEMLAIKPGDAILGAKLYPAGATTHSDEGARSLRALYPVLEVMQQRDLVLQIHGEITHGDIFDRETAFLTEGLLPLTRDFPKLRMVLEHISTRAAVDFVSEAGEQVAATITPHHLLYNRNQLLSGGIKPHYYCLPILKRERDQAALQQAAVSGNPKFFAGTDSAPHARQTKENACGCAGIYSAPYAVSLYAQVFEQLGELEKLNHFMGHFGASFYQLPINKAQLVLQKQPQQVPEYLHFGTDTVIPMAAGEELAWSVHEG